MRQFCCLLLYSEGSIKISDICELKWHPLWQVFTLLTKLIERNGAPWRNLIWFVGSCSYYFLFRLPSAVEFPLFCVYIFKHILFYFLKHFGGDTFIGRMHNKF